MGLNSWQVGGPDQPAAGPDVEQARTSRSFDVHGLRILVEGDWPEVIESVRLDFAWFEDPSVTAPHIRVEVVREEPRFDEFGDVVASFVTPRNVVYQDGPRTIIDYFGRAVSVFDRAESRLEIRGTQRDIVHEAVYQFLLSSAGAYFDSRRMPRMHGVALVGAPGAVIVMLPSGGGKTTLALRALQDGSVKLLSEDSPLLDTRGRLHPFPLRIGINATDAQRLPEGQVRRIERMEFHPKYALELSAFADRIEATPQPLRHIVIGKRSLGLNAKLVPLPRRSAIGPLLREVVVGVGLYQGLEYILQRGFGDLWRKSSAVATRARCCAAAVSHAQVWRLQLGRDHDRNWEALQPLLKGEQGASAPGG
jgi:hypothetical protein